MNLIVFDLEATCWNGNPPGKEPEIIEIGACKVNRYGEVVDTFSRFVRPIVNPNLSLYCTKLTSISQHSIDRAATFIDVIDDFQYWIGVQDNEEYTLCSWGDYDIELLEDDCDLHHVDDYWLDHYFDVQYQYLKMRGVKSRSLKVALEKEGFFFEGTPHRAIDDAANLVKIVNKFIDSWSF